MSHSPERKEVHLHLDPTMTTYQVQAEYDVASASTEEEDGRLKTLAYQQVEAALASYYQEGWVLNGTYQQSVFLERRIIGKEGSFLRGHTHVAAIVGAKVRLRRERG
jgi:hypothetical protein